MPKHPLSFVALHNQFFMQGSNLGDKINAKQRGAQLLLDDERGVVWVHFKQKVSFIPLASVASADAITIPDDIAIALQLTAAPAVDAPQGPPAVRRGRGRPPLHPEPQVIPDPTTGVPVPNFDPNDAEAAARHRELVRAASRAPTLKTGTHAQDDRLIQEARNQAMGLKHPTTSRAQVQNAEQVGATASVAGKPKPISHAQLQAQTAAEAKG